MKIGDWFWNNMVQQVINLRIIGFMGISKHAYYWTKRNYTRIYGL